MGVGRFLESLEFEEEVEFVDELMFEFVLRGLDEVGIVAL